MPGLGGGPAHKYGTAFGSAKQAGEYGAERARQQSNIDAEKARRAARKTPTGGAGVGGGGSPYPQQPTAPTPTAAGYAPPPQARGQQGAGGRGSASGYADTMGQFGEGLLDPNSDLAKSMRERISGDIGEETESAKRLAAFQASQSGMGSGGSPELMAMMGDMDIAGMESTGEAYGDLATEMPGMGLDFLRGGAGTALGVEGMRSQEGMASDALGQRERESLRAQGEGQQSREQSSWYQNEANELEREKMRQQAEFNEFAMMFQ